MNSYSFEVLDNLNEAIEAIFSWGLNLWKYKRLFL
jgi:hypothetical protein